MRRELPGRSAPGGSARTQADSRSIPAEEHAMAVRTGPARGVRTIRRAVVTGGAGFLGSHLCEHLLDRSVEVVCLDNFLTGTPENVRHLMERPGFRLLRCDITDYVHVPG